MAGIIPSSRTRRYAAARSRKVLASFSENRAMFSAVRSTLRFRTSPRR